MTDIPIICSAAMVVALLREADEPGTGKSMTRRLAWSTRFYDLGARLPVDRVVFPVPGGGFDVERPSSWQRVKPGDRLWVRETWRTGNVLNEHKPIEIKRGWGISYEADGSPMTGKIRVAIHMPRWSSRLTLVVTGTKIERLHVITEQDCEREGLRWQSVPRCWTVPGASLPSGAPIMCAQARDAFAALWDTLHGSGEWLKNPEVVAISFRVHKRNIDAMEKAA